MRVAASWVAASWRRAAPCSTCSSRSCCPVSRLVPCAASSRLARAACALRAISPGFEATFHLHSQYLS